MFNTSCMQRFCCSRARRRSRSHLRSTIYRCLIWPGVQSVRGISYGAPPARILQTPVSSAIRTIPQVSITHKTMSFSESLECHLLYYKGSICFQELLFNPYHIKKESYYLRVLNKICSENFLHWWVPIRVTNLISQINL